MKRDKLKEDQLEFTHRFGLYAPNVKFFRDAHIRQYKRRFFDYYRFAEAEITKLQRRVAKLEKEKKEASQ